MSLLDSSLPVLEPSNDTKDGSKIKVLVCTANIGNEPPNYASISEWIPNDGETKSVLRNQQYPVKEIGGKKLPSLDVFESADEGSFHIIAIGMQEATFELARELAKSLVESGPNMQKTENTKSHDCHNGQEDTQFLHQMLAKRLPSYTRAVSYQRGQMRLMIFYKRDEISMNLLSVKAQNTGKGGRDNKGGIVAECDVDSGTRISFLTAHLEAHEGLEKYKMRCSTLSDIFEGTVSELAKSSCDVSMTSHFTFAMGDLNFRTRLPDYEIGSENHIAEAHKLAKNQDWDALNEHDELMRALRNKECLVGFCTPRCDFPPTFKIERKDGYTYKSNRSPSYTDRILYKANHKLSDRIELKAYGPVDRFTTSDHKPVRGAYEIQRNQRLQFRSKSAIEDERCFGIIPIPNVWRSIVRHFAKPEANQERLDISLSSMECNILQEALSGSSLKTNLFASVLTTPNDAIKQVDDIGYSWKNLLPTNETTDPFSMEWRRTEIISNTLNPRWEKDIRFTIRSNSIPGTRVDLTGALLHVMVFNASNTTRTPLGTCSLNLASLITDSLANEHYRRISNAGEHVDETKGQAFKRSNGKRFQEILMKNGKEVGSIMLNLDLIWH